MNVIPIRDPAHAVSAAAMVKTALDAFASGERRDAIMGHVRTIIASDRVHSELHTQMVLMQRQELTALQEASWDAAQNARDHARAALPGALGLTEADIDFLRGVL